MKPRGARRLGRFIVVLLLVFFAWGCAAQDEAVDKQTGLEEEEVTRNPLFPERPMLEVLEPRYDTVYREEDIYFEIPGYITEQPYLAVVSRERLTLVDGNIYNDFDIIGYFQGAAGTENARGDRRVAWNALRPVRDGELESTGNVGLIRDGKYYFAYWTFGRWGDVDASSYQVPFYVRAEEEK